MIETTGHVIVKGIHKGVKQGRRKEGLSNYLILIMLLVLIGHFSSLFLSLFFLLLFHLILNHYYPIHFCLFQMILQYFPSKHVCIKTKIYPGRALCIPRHKYIVSIGNDGQSHFSNLLSTNSIYIDTIALYKNKYG